MAELINPRRATAVLRPTPELSRKLTDLTPLVIVGTSLWAAALVVLFVTRLTSAGPPMVWLWTCLAGAILGLIGLGVIAWQRSASRRGAKGAQRDI